MLRLVQQLMNSNIMEMIGLQLEYGTIPYSIWGYEVELIN